ncbi:MAG TPA: PA2169 family four-helix-bundle protein [Puia sp.]|jgi:uncharacterized protein (TIGR02284 family)|nr:PA2169 family four-helix-bundle protein [Puia sp.]
METLTSRETASVLDDLIKINNDRIEGYEKAVKDLLEEDKDLQLIFLKAIDQSRKIKMVLGKELQTLGADIPGGTTTGGAIHRAWLELKVSWSGHGRHAILASCEFGEDAAQKAYDTALSSEHLPEYLSRIVLEQREELREVHDQIKALRDQSK